MPCTGQLARRFFGMMFLVVTLFANTANADFWITYSISLDTWSNVTHLALSETSDNLGSLAWPYTAFGANTTEIRTLYAEADIPTQSILLGLVTDLPNDPVTGVVHAVLMMSTPRRYPRAWTGTCCFPAPLRNR